MLPEPSGGGIVVADAGLAHGGDRVEHRVAGQVGVRIRARVEQRRGQLEVRVRDRQQQRRRAGGRQPAAIAAPACRRRESSRSRRRRPSAARGRRRCRPSRTANSSGVKPDGTARVKSAPASMSACTTVGVALRPPPTSAPSARAARPCASTVRRARAAPSRRASVRCAPPSSAASRRRAAARSRRRRPSSSSSTIAPLPFVQASESGVTPYRFAAFALAPARSSSVARSPRRRGTPPSAAPSCRRPAAR